MTSTAGAVQPDLAPGPRSERTEPVERPERIGAVIVTYFPDGGALTRLLNMVQPQAERVVLVDNTPQPADARLAQGVELISNGANLGLGAAQNQGIERLRAAGMTHVLLLDQDSVPAADMVDRLLSALRRLEAKQRRVAAVGPCWRDRLSGRDVPFVRLALGRMVGAAPAPGSDLVECDTLVSSGCLIPFGVLDAVGLMDAALFIDQIDTEWGIRAQAKGYRLYGVTSAVLEHGIGESFVRPWFAPQRSVPVHSPVRDYFLVRNSVAVFFRRPAPWRWRLLQLVRLPAVMLVMVTQMPERTKRLHSITMGLIDGLLLRLGPARLH